MAQCITANDYRDSACLSAGDYMATGKPISARDFIAGSAPRRACLASDAHGSIPQSQVDKLISDLMDIIVRASAIESPRPASADAVAEVVALSMMQALLHKDLYSSY